VRLHKMAAFEHRASRSQVAPGHALTVRQKTEEPIYAFEWCTAAAHETEAWVTVELSSWRP